MNQRGGIGKFFLFAFLSVIVLLQILTMRQHSRLAEHLDSIDAETATERVFAEPKRRDSDIEEYPGDEGDWLVWAFRVEPKTLNQLSTDRDIYSMWITKPQIFEPLTVYDWDEVKLNPLLAEDYQISSDGLEITFLLRDDIHFSDGVPITADDVIFTYNTVTNPGVDAANLANMYVDVDRAVKVDDRTVKFIMKRPYFKALEITCLWDFGVYPKHIYSFDDPNEFNKRVSEPVGSGPYVFERWDVGEQIVLRRNENYWGPKPRIKKVIYRFITNAVAAAQALRAHEVDLIIPEPDQFADLVEDKEFNKEFDCLWYWNPGAPFYYIGWNQDTPFFSDRRVRLAMTHVINREQIVAELLKGFGEITTGPYYIKGTQYDSAIEPWPYAPDRARELLDEAGWVDSDGDGIRDKDGVTFRFKFMYSTGKAQYQRLAKLLKDEMAKVAVELIADPYEWSVMLPKLSDREFEAMVMGWGGDIVEDNYQIFHSSQIGNRGSNYVGYSNAEADVLLEKIRRTMNTTERDMFCHELHSIIHAEQPYTFLFARPTFRPVDKRFENVNIHYMGLNYLEWYVPKDKQRYD